MLVNQLEFLAFDITYAGNSVLWASGDRATKVVDRHDVLLWEFGGVDRGYYQSSGVRFDNSMFVYDKPLMKSLSANLPWLYPVNSSRDLAYNTVMKYSKHLRDNGVPHGFGGLWALYLAIDAGMFFEPDVKYIFPLDPVNKIYEDGSYNADPYLIKKRRGNGARFEIGLFFRSNYIEAGTRLVLAGTKYEPEKYSAAPASAIGIGRKR